MIREKVKGETDNISLEGVLEPADVLLVISPLNMLSQPSLGIHLLQASCREAGINTSVLYSNFFYSNLIGANLHETIARDQCLLLSERIFAAAAFDLPAVSIGQTMHNFSDPGWVPDHLWQVKPEIKDLQVPTPVVLFREWLDTLDLEYLESVTIEWLHTLAQRIVDIGFRIAGCSTSLGGLVPAVALLNCIKKADPEVITILGGALCEGEMADGILSLNAGIDYIFSGDGEITFPALARQILESRLPKEKIIYGRDVTDLDTIPLPDYRDYMYQREKFYPLCSCGKNEFALPFETSRGCWYGKCTFCGLNGEKNLYRAKSSGGIIKSLKALVERHHIYNVFMNDNMMPVKYFDDLFPRISIEMPSIKIFYMMRANPTLDQILTLKKAGITEIQAGIESLSPSLLGRMQKPCTVRGNIALLRYARSAGLDLRWNLLFGFPGDQIVEYKEMLHLLPLIRHLQPPRQVAPLALSRFSKYQRSPEKFGISDLRPSMLYKDILPSHPDLDKIAYYFTADFPSQSRENPAIINALWEECRAWFSAWATYEAIPLDILLPTLHVVRKSSDRYVLEDTRGLPGRPKLIEINRDRAGLLLVARPLETVPDADVGWALDAGLGVIRESWYIPLATSDPTLLQELESDYKRPL